MADDPLVKLSDGRIMRLSEFKALQQQQIDAFTKQMTVTIEDLNSLSGAVSGSAGETWSAKYQLQSDMAGIENAFGTDDQGKKFRDSWNGSFNSLLDGFDQVASNIDSVAGSLSQAADQLFKTESDTLKGFGITAVEPRPKPSMRSGPNRAF
jgi:uncharacterized phage infection (PIP) family protein YhgE